MEERKDLIRLFNDATAYRSSRQYKELLEFVVRFRRFSSFNAALLHRQKPGLSFATSVSNWREQWKRTIKADASPLVILVPFGPVGFVYDIQDTEALTGAPELPEDVFAFPATGNVAEGALRAIMAAVEKHKIRIVEVNEGDWHAGRIERKGDAYSMKINSNHSRETRLTTIAHELAHLYLGHLGEDSKLRIPDRRRVSTKTGEIEAESVAFIVCRRHGVDPKSASYLSNFTETDKPIDESLDIERVMKAASTVEKQMGLAHAPFEDDVKKRREWSRKKLGITEREYDQSFRLS